MTLITIYTTVAQLEIDGFKEAAQQNTLFAVLVSIILILFSTVLFIFKKLDNLQTKYTTKMDDIRIEMMTKEDERNKQWRESEKETLIVLKGVNSVLEMSEKMKENDTQKIIDKIRILEKIISNGK